MTRKAFISPHPDDECLWGAYTLQKENPDVYIFRVFTELWRNDESRAALEYIGLTASIRFIDRIDQVPLEYDVVYAPAFEDGHPDHNRVCLESIRRWGPKVVLYSTYGHNKAVPPFGRWIVDGVTERMKKRKVEALRLYDSQRKVAAVHFNLECKDEYYF